MGASLVSRTLTASTLAPSPGLTRNPSQRRSPVSVGFAKGLEGVSDLAWSLSRPADGRKYETLRCGWSDRSGPAGRETEI